MRLAEQLDKRLADTADAHIKELVRAAFVAGATYKGDLSGAALSNAATRYIWDVEDGRK